ncbi:unnamed protein product [Caenorhabditis sp. 36 PRJEB53466]|nr:unnamed protein product [Caenorhabditis sp. 36 PRJEB53466]
MFSLNHLICLLLTVAIALMTTSSAQPIDTDRPIFMERREASAFGDIIGELKGKGLGGRMRFGKRSSSPEMSLSELRAIYGGGPLELVQY